MRQQFGEQRRTEGDEGPQGIIALSQLTGSDGIIVLAVSDALDNAFVKNDVGVFFLHLCRCRRRRRNLRRRTWTYLSVRRQQANQFDKREQHKRENRR